MTTTLPSFVELMASLGLESAADSLTRRPPPDTLVRLRIRLPARSSRIRPAMLLRR